MHKQSKRQTFKQTYDIHGEKIEIVHVSEGYDGGHHWVKEHYLFIKHRGGAVSSHIFPNIHSVEKHFNSKRNPFIDVVIFVSPSLVE